MKKLLLTTFIGAAFASSVLAQGIVNWSASTAQNRPVRFTTDGVVSNNIPAGNPAQIAGFGSVNITAYAASAGTALQLRADGSPDFTGWLIAGQIDHNIAPSAGNAPTFGFTMDAALGAAATPVQFIIVGWTGAFTDFNSAYQSGTSLVGWSGSARSGGALSWNQPTGTPVAPVVVTFGAGGFAGLTLAPVPEPGTIALGGLGVAALLLFRRRK